MRSTVKTALAAVAKSRPRMNKKTAAERQKLEKAARTLVRKFKERATEEQVIGNRTRLEDYAARRKGGMKGLYE